MKPPNQRDIHAEAERLPFHALVRALNSNVGPTVVQAMAGTPDPSATHQWATPGAQEPRHEVVDRLRLGYRVWRTLESEEGANIALAWLVGANPRLGETTPVSAVRNLSSAEVISAALAFIDGG